MRQKAQSLWSALVAVVAVAGMSVFMVQPHAFADPTAPSAAPASDTVDMGDGLTAYFPMPIEDSNIQKDALAAIKKWRQDALTDTNVKWGDPAKTIKEYLAENSMTEEDYLNVKWSHDLNLISQIRATESVLHSEEAHKRLTDADPLDIQANGNFSDAEVIAWGVGNVTGAVDTWAEEKADYVNATPNKITGHYEYLINPDILRYAVSGIAAGHLGSTFVGEGSALPLENETYAERPTYVGVKVPVTAVDLTKLTTGIKDVIEGASYDLSRPKAATTTYGREAFIGGTWKSLSDENATVAKGDGDSTFVVTGVKQGVLSLQFVPDISPEPMATTNAQTYASNKVTAKVITSVDNPADITVPSGTMPSLPEKVVAHWNNGKNTEETVTWKEAADPNYYKARQGGDTMLTGTVDGLEDPVHLTVHVTPATVKEVTPKNSEVTTESGTAPVLPETATVKWSNEETTQETIKWGPVSKGQYSNRKGGYFTVEGTVANTQEVVHAVVTVNPATIVSAADPAETITTVGQKPQLPANVKVTWSNGDMSYEQVTWNEVETTMYDHENTFMVEGTVGGQTVHAPVKVVEATIVSVEPLSDITVPSGTQPELPKTVIVTLSDGSQAKQAITFKPAEDENYYKARKGTDVTLVGMVAGWDKPVNLQIHVEKAKALQAEIIGDSSIEVESGAEGVKLPENAKVTWSNGDITTEAITWENGAADALAKAVMNVDDLIITFDGAVDEAAVQFMVTVNHATATDPELMYTTEAGKAPMLPEMVTIHWSNGLDLEEKVTWDAIDADQYAAEGEFTVTGHLTDHTWADPITAKVKVTAAMPSMPEPEASNPVVKLDDKKVMPAADKKDLAKTGADTTIIALAAMFAVAAAGAVVATRRRVR